MPRRPDYGLDSPAIIAGELVLGGLAVAGGLVLARLHVPRWPAVVCWVAGGYFLLSAASMVFYSKVGKLYIRDQLLRSIPWRGDELVLDVGCGRGLLLVGAARRLTTGKAVGVDVWAPGAITGNRPEAARDNAALEGVADRVEVKPGDARHLPFADASFDVVVSNFVLHELDSRVEREQMLREMSRVLKPGGQVALVDFIFTGEAARALRKRGMGDVRRIAVGPLYSWVSALTSLGVVRLYQVLGRKAPAMATGA